MRYILLSILLAACAPTRPADTAVVAVVLVDDALAVTIAALPADADLAPWEARVNAVERAAALVQSGGDRCDALAILAVVATDTRCARCSTAIAAARETIQCR